MKADNQTSMKKKRNMRLLKADILVLSISAVIITTFSFLLYLDLTKRIEFGETQSVGNIIFKRKVAQRKYNRQVIWEEVEQNQTLYNRDSIRTADNSDAVIKLKDGTRIELGENSMILLSLSSDAININFAHGTIYAKRDTVGKEDLKKLTIKSNDTSVSIDTSNIKVSESSGKDIQVIVSKGTANIKTGNNERVVTNREKATIRSATGEMTVEKVIYRLIRPHPNEFAGISGTVSQVGFTWDQNNYRGISRCELSRDSSFAGILNYSDTSGSSASFSLSPGEYYWRVRAMNGQGESSVSETRRFTVLQVRPVSLRAPEPETTISYLKEPPLVQFHWRKNSIASSYIIEVARTRDMKNPVKSVDSLDSMIGIAIDQPGTYYWRVTPKSDIISITDRWSSPVSSFTVTKQTRYSAPVLHVPENNEKISTLELAHRKLIFNWEANPEIRSFRIRIAADREFSKQLITKDIDTNYHAISSSLNPGTWYWRVAALNRGIPVSDYSTSGSFIITGKESIELRTPSDNATLYQKKDTDQSGVSFSWKRISIPGSYKLEISKNRQFNQVYREYSVQGYSIQPDDIAPGTMYWRVRFIGEKSGKELTRSDVRSFTLEAPLKTPELISPVHTALDMKLHSSIPFQWRKIRGATSYEITLFAVRRGTRHLVFSERTANEQYRFSRLKLLDRGEYVWTLKALRTEAGGGKTVQESGISRGMFTIKLNVPYKKPKILSPETQYIQTQ
ncbi:MAG TPA: FecR family protein [Spirochaetota bacterium]|nr:FecR family protein [Spirochaetota bacterium]